LTTYQHHSTSYEVDLQANGPFSASLLAFTLDKPADGYPILEDWSNLARDIYHSGWESHRGAIEIQLTSAGAPGQPLEFGSLTPSKGFGRVSALMFGVLWTYQNMSSLNDVQKSDFIRLMVSDVLGSKG